MGDFHTQQPIHNLNIWGVQTVVFCTRWWFYYAPCLQRRRTSKESVAIEGISPCQVDSEHRTVKGALLSPCDTPVPW